MRRVKLQKVPMNSINQNPDESWKIQNIYNENISDDETFKSSLEKLFVKIKNKYIIDEKHEFAYNWNIFVVRLHHFSL